MAITPGPYEIFKGKSRTEILCKYGVPIAQLYANGRANGAAYHLDVDANAALFRVAPELLEACRALINSTDYCGDDRPLMQRIRAAIAKAEPTEE